MFISMKSYITKNTLKLIVLMMMLLWQYLLFHSMHSMIIWLYFICMTILVWVALKIGRN